MAACKSLTASGLVPETVVCRNNTECIRGKRPRHCGIGYDGGAGECRSFLHRHQNVSNLCRYAERIFVGKSGESVRQGRRIQQCRAEVENEVSDKPTASDDKRAAGGSSQLDQLEQLGFGKRGSSKKGGKATTKRRPAPEKPVIDVASKEPTQNQLFESYYVGALATIFGVIIAMGIGLAAAGFLPKEWDDWILAYIYPNFSPTIGVFLLGSSIYGLYKYLGGPKVES